MCFPSYVLAILNPGPFPKNLGIDLARFLPLSQYLIKVSSNLALNRGSGLILNWWD